HIKRAAAMSKALARSLLTWGVVGFRSLRCNISHSAMSVWGRCQAGLDPIPDQIALKLGQAGHDGAHELAAGGAEIEAEARLGQHGDFPAVQIVERLDEVLGATAPSAEFGDQDSVDLARSR